MRLGCPPSMSTVFFRSCVVAGSGLITLRGGAVHVLNWEGLKAAGDFNPTSLHLARNETL
jgi:hypothetical protein